jgi:hypothetical protein
MPDFDANDDSLRLGDSGKEEPLELPKLYPRFMPRARELAYAQCSRRSESRAVRVQAKLATARRRAAHRRCPVGSREKLHAATPRRRRRRLWTKCHGRLPGSLS